MGDPEKLEQSSKSKSGSVKDKIENLRKQLVEKFIVTQPLAPLPPPPPPAQRNQGEHEMVSDALEKLEYYCISLDEMMEVGKKFISARKELTSLREIRRQLSTSSNIMGASVNDRYAVIEDNVPEELKCPVCFEIFESQVLQCKNGHSICCRCCETLTECPECRENYSAGKIRNRTVENLMNSLKVDCIYNGAGCLEKLTCGEMQIHMETCAFMNKPVRSPEYKEVRRQIKTRDGDSKRLEKRMQETNKRLMKAKAAWEQARDGLPSSQDFGSSSPLSSVENAIGEFRLATREMEMTTLYVDLNEMVTA